MQGGAGDSSQKSKKKMTIDGKKRADLLEHEFIPEELMGKLQALSSDDLEMVNAKVTQALRTQCAFIDDTGNEAELVEELKASKAGSYVPLPRGNTFHGPPDGDGTSMSGGCYKNNVGIFYNSNSSGESITNPKTRLPPFRQQHFKHLAGAVLKTRSKLVNASFEGIHPADVYMVDNGGKDGLNTSILAAFVSSKGEKLPMHVLKKDILIDEESINRRRGKCRGPVNQLETLMMITQAGKHQHTQPTGPTQHTPNPTPHAYQTLPSPHPTHTQPSPRTRPTPNPHPHQTHPCPTQPQAGHPTPISNKKKVHYPGTARGSILGPVVLDDPEDDRTMKLTMPIKKELYGKNRIAVGGPSPDTDEKIAKGMSTAAFHNVLPEEAKDELVNIADVGAIIDLTPEQGTLAMVALRRRLPYVAVTFGTEHGKLMKAFLHFRILAAKMNEGDTLYDAKITQVLQDVVIEKSKAAAKAASKNKTQTKTKPSAKAVKDKAAKKVPPGPGGGAEPKEAAKVMDKQALMARIKSLAGAKGGGKAGGSAPKDDDDEDEQEDAEEEEEEEAEGEEEVQRFGCDVAES